MNSPARRSCNRCKRLSFTFDETLGFPYSSAPTIVLKGWGGVREAEREREIRMQKESRKNFTSLSAHSRAHMAQSNCSPFKQRSPNHRGCQFCRSRIAPTIRSPTVLQSRRCVLCRDESINQSRLPNALMMNRHPKKLLLIRFNKAQVARGLR